MQCQFCHQDVPDPCHDTAEVHVRAEAHVDRCEDAEKHQDHGQAGEGRPDPAGSSVH